MQTVRTTMMTKPARIGGALLMTLLGLSPASALAKDICVHEVPVGLTYLFSKVKTLRPGRVVPLTGTRIFAIGSNAVPVHGSALMRTDGKVVIGVVVHNMSPLLGASSSNFLVSMETDADFTGSGTLDADGDFTADLQLGPVTWTSVDCSTIAIP
jgi:hypothetical protein